MSKFRREEGGGDWRYKPRRLSGGKDLAVCEEQAVMGTTWYTFRENACQWTSELSTYFLDLGTWNTTHTHNILQKYILWQSEEGCERAHVCVHMHANTHTYACTPIKFLLMPKAKKGGRKGSFEPRTEQSFFTICHTRENLMSHKFQWVFPSIFQFVLFCKYLYSDDNVTFVIQPHWLPHEELYFESEDIC